MFVKYVISHTRKKSWQKNVSNSAKNIIKEHNSCSLEIAKYSIGEIKQ